jgi:hypothetical protein
MTTTILLEDAIEEIIDAMIAAIDDARQESDSDAPLAAVQKVIRGNRTRPMPDLPAIWVVPQVAVNAQTSPGLAEVWTMPVTIAAMVKDDDPDDGSRLAARLAARARSVVLGGRRLGLDYVNDVVSTNLNPVAVHGNRNRNIHATDATVTVRFLVRERP